MDMNRRTIKKNLRGMAFAVMLLAFGTTIACGQGTAVRSQQAADKNRNTTTAKHGESNTATVKSIVQYELPAKLTDRPEQIVRRKAYTVSYNSTTKCPNWVAWHLTKEHTYGKVQRSNEKFIEDPTTGGPDNYDYINSRYDRGHMCPAGDNKWDATAMTETFYFSNICPQNHNLNKYEWNDLEMRCREWARRYGSVDIVCGPIYLDNNAPRHIGASKVRVPDAFFKVVLCRKNGGKAIGFYYKNDGKKVSMADAVRTVDQIEKLTGIDFFHQLDDTTESRVEAKANISDW